MAFLSGNETHVWRTHLELSPPAYELALEVLSADEHERAARFHFEEHRRRFVAARSFQRQVLASYLNLRPSELSFQTEPNGKPFLVPKPAIDIRFNLSHSGSEALMAVAVDRAVGIDIERIRPMSEWLDVAKRHFSAVEVEQLADLPESDRHNAFFECWTLKEAWIKGIGIGLSFPLDGFNVRIGSGDGNRLLSVSHHPLMADRWWLGRLPAHPGYVAAIAVEVEPGTPIFRPVLVSKELVR